MSTWTVAVAEVNAILETRVERPDLLIDTLLQIMGGDGDSNPGQLRAQMESRSLPERMIPKAFHWAGEDLGASQDPELWPKLLVGARLPVEEFGRDWKLEATVNLTVAWPFGASRRERREALAVATVVSGVLRHPNYQRFNHPETGAVVWGHLMPTGYAMVPEDWQHWSGWMATFLVRQLPGGNLW